MRHFKRLSSSPGTQWLPKLEIAARITKLLAEAEREKAEARKMNVETDQLEFMIMVRKLKLVLEAQALLNPDASANEESKRLQSFIGLLNEHGRN